MDKKKLNLPINSLWNDFQNELLKIPNKVEEKTEEKKEKKEEKKSPTFHQNYQFPEDNFQEKLANFVKKKI
jgi:hypothetical protein